jgi:hypothetical protein
VRVLRYLHRLVFNASRAGRAAEIAGWSNALAGLAFGAGVYWLFHSVPGALGTVIILFVLLRGALANRYTLWIAAACGSLAVSAAGGGLAWVFGHVIEHPAAPPILAIFASILSATVPAWAYAQVARQREAGPDSLLEPVSAPSSPRSR